MLCEFRLMNYRSCRRALLHFERKNLFIGANGSGKSNLLEAIGFLGVLRSFRTVRPAELIMHNCSQTALRGVWQQPGKLPLTLEVALERSGSRRLLINGNCENSGREFIRHFYPVVFAPEDMELICGMPQLRRRFFDMLACQLDDGYINVLHDYQRALKLRNLLLKSAKADPVKLEVYEGLMAFAGSDLTQRRRQLIDNFNAVLKTLAADPDSMLLTDYRPYCNGDPEEYLAMFSRNRSRELEKRTTLTGCHLDEYQILRGGHIMRGFASNGQNRLAALHCKLTAALMLMRNRGAEQLLALVDDVTGELDEYNRQQFYELLQPAGQSFFTFTEKPSEKFFSDSKLFTMPL